MLPDFGPLAQQRLRQARVLVVGAGGLGCPALQYLAAAGVGHIGLLDGDVVSLSNLNRQVLYGLPDVGQAKVAVAQQRLSAQYPDIGWQGYPYFMDAAVALRLLPDYDLVLDCTDNFPTRYLIDDACALLGKPLVTGAIYQHQGQVALLHAGPNPVGYRDLYPQQPDALQAPNCQQVGVLGVIAGLIGVLQATEAIKWLSGWGKPLCGQLLCCDLRDYATFCMELSPSAEGRALRPATPEAILATDYGQGCAWPGHVATLAWPLALAWATQPGIRLLDVREAGELPEVDSPQLQAWPLSRLLAGDLPVAETLLLACQNGSRSTQLQAWLQKRHPHLRIYSVQGGILHPDSPLNQYHGA